MRYAYLIISTVVFFGCGSATTKIGTACKKTGDCNVPGQKCVPQYAMGAPTGASICTHSCQGEYGATGCPIGYDCSVNDMNIGLTCNKAPYSVDGSGTPLLFGKACQADSDCAGTGDPNANPVCRHALDPTSVFGPFSTPPKPLTGVKQDPAAYCTGSCTDDRDCPISMTCIADYNDLSGDPSQKRCVKRSSCDSCTLNDHCSSDFPVCASGSGSASYCTKPCNSDNDCPGGAQSAAGGYANYMLCKLGLDASGNPGKYCFHYFGSCKGQGAICDPCRNESDCTGGSHCFINTQSLERFCTKVCLTDGSCGAQAVCDNKQPMTTSDPQPTGLCIGTQDSTKPFTGDLSCHFM